jgi:hypothetical protein
MIIAIQGVICLYTNRIFNVDKLQDNREGGSGGVVGAHDHDNLERVLRDGGPGAAHGDRGQDRAR